MSLSSRQPGVSPSGVRRERAGLTMMELLVAMAILSIMVVSFGMIFAETQKVVTTGETMMRSNAVASAIAQIVRADLRKVSASGFLCITQGMDGSGLLLMTSVAATPSKTGAVTGAAGLGVFGLCENLAGDTDVLFHQTWVLSATGTGDDVWVSSPDDIQSLADIQALSRTEVNDLIDDVNAEAPPDVETAGESISIPPNNLSDIGALWQVLASHCDRFEVTWTDNGTDWYGVTHDGASYVGTGKLVAWSGTPILDDLTQIEFDDGYGNYRALWTNHNKANWPRAVRVRFSLADPKLSPGYPTTYEVICPVSR